MKKAVLCAVLMLTAQNATSQEIYYRCEDARGQPVFSQRPCGDNAEVGTLSGKANQDRQEANKATWARVTASNALREAKRELDRREDRVREIERERDTRLAALKSRSNRANNNLAGAQLIEGMATEMQAVTQQYEAWLAREYRDIDRLEERMQRLQRLRDQM